MIHRLPLAKVRIKLGEVVRRVHLNHEYFILEKAGIPVAGIMDAEELEDYLELRNPEAQRQIQKSNEDIRAGRIRPAEKLLAEFRKSPTRKSKGMRPKGRGRLQVGLRHVC